MLPAHECLLEELKRHPDSACCQRRKACCCLRVEHGCSFYISYASTRVGAHGVPRVSCTQEKREGCCNCSRKLSEGTEWSCVLVGGGTNRKIKYLLMLIDKTCKSYPETIARNTLRSIWSYVLKGGYQIHCFVDAT